MSLTISRLLVASVSGMHAHEHAVSGMHAQCHRYARAQHLRIRTHEHARAHTCTHVLHALALGLAKE